jgi:thiol-disulfide isomerase/thioredoxin
LIWPALTPSRSTKWSDKRADAAASIQKWEKEPVSLQPLDEATLTKLVKNDTENLLLINVWVTYCGPCVAELPEFVVMNRMYRNREFELISISMDNIDKKNAALSFLTRKQASMKNYIFKGDKYAFIEALDKNWEGSLPYTLFIAPGGKIIYGKQGVIDALALKKVIVEQIGRVY